MADKEWHKDYRGLSKDRLTGICKERCQNIRTAIRATDTEVRIPEILDENIIPETILELVKKIAEADFLIYARKMKTTDKDKIELNLLSVDYSGVSTEGLKEIYVNRCETIGGFVTETDTNTENQLPEIFNESAIPTERNGLGYMLKLADVVIRELNREAVNSYYKIEPHQGERE